MTFEISAATDRSKWASTLLSKGYKVTFDTSTDRTIPFIEIDSIEELVSMSKEIGEPIIIYYAGYRYYKCYDNDTILIYDDCLE